jgi:hypothetical protein
MALGFGSKINADFHISNPVFQYAPGNEGQPRTARGQRDKPYVLLMSEPRAVAAILHGIAETLVESQLM